MKCKYRYRPRRRGVLILVVLSLLVLFTLITVTYVVVSKQALSSSQTANRYEQVRPDNEALIHTALMQMLVGTENRNSSLLGHSLGGDMYGTWLTGTVGSAGAMGATDNQFVQLQVTVDHLDTDPNFPNVEDYYRGRVLTMIDGPAAGLSTRIVFSSENENTLHVMAFSRTDPNGVIAVVPEQGNLFLINGREFAGVRPSLNNMQALEPSLLNVNLSNATFGSNDNVVRNALARLNETYDAVDHNSMFLGRFPEDPWIGRPENAPQPSEAWERRIIPSFHRPALIRNKGALTKTLLRPSPKDHYLAKDPNDGNMVIDFTGKRYAVNDLTDGFDPSQKVADLVNGPWDVDTDGDGILDAVWLDLGFPVLKTADGRSYKPLFAIRCQDLDGRVNVNAHGSKAQTRGDYETFDGRFALARGNGDVRNEDGRGLWKGRGVSPAEVNPRYVYATDTANGVPRFDIHDDLLNERYGVDAEPDNRDMWTADRRSRIGPFRMPDSYDPTSRDLNNFSKSYASPPDRQGLRFVGLDHRGQPIYSDNRADRPPPFGEFSGTPPDPHRDPHRMVLTRFSPVGPSDNLAPDEPYSVYELERVFRRYDRDASLLPDRLLRQIDPQQQNASSGVRRPRQNITVASFGHPRPPIDIVELVRQDGRVSNINTWVRNNLAPELLAGLPMDLNRPFGDGMDNDGDRIVDEPDEGRLNSAWDQLFGAAAVPLDLNNDGTVDDNDGFARQIFARHLYCLAMLLVDRSYEYDFDGDGRGSRAETARWLAQWAVNVVDFRDSDAIMTRFAYDPNPFDGWNADEQDEDLPTTDDDHMKTVVYGCEQPLLLLSEMVSWHDRRTQKVDTTTGDASDEDDAEFRQAGRPRGNLLVELYHPRNPHHVAPGRLYGAMGQGLKLNQVDAETSRSGVWRLAFTAVGPTDPGLRGIRSLVLPTDKIDTVAYFTNNTNPANHPNDDLALELNAQDDVGRRFYASGPNLTSLKSNSYVIVAPAKRLMFGKRAGTVEEEIAISRTAKEKPNVYPIEINLEPAGGIFRRIKIDGTKTIRPRGRDNYKDNVVVIMAPQFFNAAGTRDSGRVATGKKRRFSVSEPRTGYDIETDLVDGDDIDYKYFEKDVLKTKVPLDAQRATVKEDRTTLGYRNIYLQRLADPTRRWNRQTNPYLVVDVMSSTDKTVDLTSYSGDDSNSPDVSKFSSRQRGNDADDLWRAESTAPIDADGDLNLPIEKNTIGFLNREFGELITADNNEYRGDSALNANNKPFPWLTWNNRPFVSQLELLLVPGTDSYRLVTLHNTHERGRNGMYNPYNPTSQQPGQLPPAPFPHLMNFFHTRRQGGSPAPELIRLLEFTHVPSAFVGTQHWLSPTAFRSGVGTEKYHPPFNKVSTYRQPGRMNVNTIFSKEVFRSLMNNPDTTMVDATWNRFLETRRGLPRTASASDRAALPTEYSNPFRSSYEAGRVPLESMRRIGANATLLRSRLGGAEDSPLLAGTSNSVVNDAVRNPFFRYQPLMRLGNLTTTRSNVYAIWITLGFFEVSSTDPENPTRTLPVNVIYKDGYRLVRELGSETGDVRRHRAFYIVDRSIPFGFQRGKAHNVHNTILLSRQIE